MECDQLTKASTRSGFSAALQTRPVKLGVSDMGILKRGQRTAAKKKKRKAERARQGAEMRALLPSALNGDMEARDQFIDRIRSTKRKSEAGWIEQQVRAATTALDKDAKRDEIMKKIDERNRGVGILQDAHVPSSHIRKIDKGRKRK